MEIYLLLALPPAPWTLHYRVRLTWLTRSGSDKGTGSTTRDGTTQQKRGRTPLRAVGSQFNTHPEIARRVGSSSSCCCSGSAKSVNWSNILGEISAGHCRSVKVANPFGDPSCFPPGPIVYENIMGYKSGDNLGDDAAAQLKENLRCVFTSRPGAVLYNLRRTPNPQTSQMVSFFLRLIFHMKTVKSHLEVCVKTSASLNCPDLSLRPCRSPHPPFSEEGEERKVNAGFILGVEPGCAREHPVHCLAFYSFIAYFTVKPGAANPSWA
ncbi:hypothetical protein Q5P01_009682 [Channa striata]|uniref:Uncharacterized protein n=1 Tax=Channa striata TaxID=64152 RepID=A0AA88SPR2_CHASR|nr:hypothetical protein Q5P01_009682 [Channa striata]